MPRYMLSVYGPAERERFGGYPDKEAMLQAFADTGAFNDKLEREGYFVFADGLEPATTATTVATTAVASTASTPASRSGTCWLMEYVRRPPRTANTPCAKFTIPVAR